MAKRRTSLFSRVVSFITAMSMAMLVVTVAHREVISAETGEDLVQTVSADEMVQMYSDIQTFAGEGSDTYVNAEEHIKVSNAEIYLNGAPLQPNTNIGDGQKLALELEWYIPAELDGDFSGQTFAWDITDQIHGIDLETKEYSVKENGKVIATYKIESKDGKIMMYITPKKGFDEKHFNKRGSIMLNGTTSLDKITDNGQGGDPYIKFFEDPIKVKVPKADVYVQKAAGDIRKDGDDYYQKFTVYIYNNSSAPADANKTLLVDKPGSVFEGNPINATFTYSSTGDSQDNEGVKNVGTVTTTGDDRQFEISVGSLSGYNNVLVEYELKLDTSKLFTSDGELAVDSNNTVYIKEVKEEEKDPQTVGVNIKKLEPSINKSGTYDSDNDMITWKITVSPNYFKTNDFVVTDIIDDTNSKHNFVAGTLNGAAVSADGKTITINKDQFTPPKNENEPYTFEYKTSVPSDVAEAVGAKRFVNKAEVKFDGNTKTYEKTSSAEVRSTLMTKNFKGLNGNTLMWEISVVLPEDTTKIRIEDYIGETVYESSRGTNDMFRYSSVKVLNADGTEYKNNTINGTDSIVETKDYKWIYGVWPNANGGSMDLEISDTDFLTKNSGKKIKFVYGIELLGNYDIDLLSKFVNTANFRIEGSHPDSGRDDAEYTADVSVTKNLNDWYPSPIFDIGNGLYDNDLISKVENPNRNNRVWMVTVSFPNGLELDQPIKIEDKLTGENADGYRYTGDLLDGNPKLWTVGLANDAWGVGFKKLSEGNGNSFNFYTRSDNTLIFDATINNEADLDAINNGKYLTLMYHTSMTEDYYTAFNTGNDEDSKPDHFTNTATVSVNGGKEYIGKKDFSVAPDSRVFDKEGQKIEGTDDVEYTLHINEDSLMLGARDTDPIVTDRIGARLKLDESSITINGRKAVKGTDYTFDSDNNVLKFIKLKDRTSYEIKYKVRINKLLPPTATSDDISDETREQYYGNDATISFGNSDGTTTKKFDSFVLGLNDVKGDGSISSEMNGLKINFTKNWENWNAKNPIPSSSVVIKITGTVPDATDEERAKYPNQVGDIEETISIEGDKDTSTWSTNTTLRSKGEIPSDVEGEPSVIKYYKYTIKEVKLGEAVLNGLDYKITFSDSNNNSYNDSYTIDVNDLEPNASGNYEEDLTITNKRTEPKISITVSKTWIGDNLPDHEGGNPMDSRGTVTVNVNGSDGSVHSVTLGDKGADGKAIWTKTIDDLPKIDADGKTITYTADEVIVPNYTSSISPNSISGDDGRFTVINTYNDPNKTKVDITVVKKWEGDNLPNLKGGNPKNKRTPVTINIYQYDGDDNKVETIPVQLTQKANATADNDDVWSATITGLPGEPYTYDVEEVSVTGNYTVGPKTESTTATGQTFTVTNKYKPEKINISVTKKWVDDGNQNVEENRSVELEVYRGYDVNSCNKFVGRLELSENGNLTGSLENLDKYDSTGRLYYYIVKEPQLPENYKFSVDPPFISGEDGDFTVTNTYDDNPTPEPEKIKITVNKEWLKDTGHEGERSTVTVNVKGSDGSVYPVTLPVKVDGKDVWSDTIEVPKTSEDGEITYTAEEISVENYTTKNPSNSIKGADGTFTVTNTYDNPTPEPDKIKITVNKEWLKDTGHEGERSTVTVNVKGSDGSVYPVTLPVKVDGKDVWSDTIEVPKTSEDGEITYTAEEISVENYTTKNPSNSIKGADGTFTVTNTYDNPTPEPDKIKITVNKEWLKDTGHEGERSEVTVNVKGSDGSVYPVTLAKEDGKDVWSETIEVPKTSADGETITYTAEEVAVAKYTTSNPLNSITGEDGEFTVTNTYNNSTPEPEPEKIKITVNKVWLKDTGHEGERSAVTVNVKGSDGSVYPVTLAKEDGKDVWSETIEVPKTSADGETITYTAEEVAVAKYTTSNPLNSITGEDGEFTITNTYDNPPNDPNYPPNNPPDNPNYPPNNPPDNPNYPPNNPPDNPSVPVRPVPPRPPIVFTPVETTPKDKEPVETTPVHEEEIEDEEIEYEDVSSAAEIFDDTDEAVKRDNILIIILVAIIIIGNSILFYRSKTVDSYRKYRM
ncbi:MAG: Cna B-type domain-containing protein [Oscillospiraceae bacterium]|nr:Cna B-type domain-containing protein [Oscillospiraceae bacterium]